MRGSISFPQLWITDFVKRWKRKLSQWNEEQPKGISEIRVTWTFTSLLFPVPFLYQKWFVSGPDFQLFSFFLIKKYYYCVYMMCAHNVCEDMGHCTWGGQGQCRNQFSPFTFTHVPGTKLRLPGGLAKATFTLWARPQLYFLKYTHKIIKLALD